MNLWYTSPATKWVEALPVGNGRIGGMVFGKLDAERIALNEDTLWSGYPRNQNPRNKAPVYTKVRDLAMNRQFHEANELYEDELTSGWTQAYMPLGDLLLDFPHSAGDKYKRTLDMDRAVAETCYEYEGTSYRREVFVSAPDDLMVIRLSANKPAQLSLRIQVQSQLRASVHVNDNTLIMEGIAPSYSEPSYSNALTEPLVYADHDEEKGMRFALMLMPLVSGGIVSSDGESLCIVGADSVVLLVNVQTSFAGFDVQPYTQGKDEKAICRAALERVRTIAWAELLTRHIEDYQSYYHRVTLFLGENEYAALPTNERLLRFNGDDPALYTLLFQYGRYLLISGSRPGTQPTNLQGIWNSDLRPAWSSNFTININTQMNYWPVFSCDLAELQEPLVAFIRELALNGQKTARETYGVEGFVSHHNADIWRHSSAVGNHERGYGACVAWNLSAGWLCEHLFEAWEYTQDCHYLDETAWPLMKEAARYLKALLVQDEHGRLMLCPSTSPENNFIWQGKPTGMARTTTMSMAIIRELFQNCITVSQVLGKDAEFAAELSTLLNQLYPFQIGSKGQLLEWDDEYEEAEPHHRHQSHLYALYPASLISLEKTPELAQACKRSLELRGDEGTGWSLAWKLNLWARLHDGDHALRILRYQLRFVDEDNANCKGGGTYPNMFDAHPPFQIDGNFGVTAGIAELLLQNIEGGIHLLPALPSAWKAGFCKGLCAKRRVTVDISWNEQSVSATLLSALSQPLNLYCRGVKQQRVELQTGKPLTLEIAL
ncbi:MAG: glycoside hydrolase family 95 protein [Treponema sp.]|nr:glycoside hydrolase family 95 protein [Treponema sp.]